MKKNIIEIEFEDFMWLLAYITIITSVMFFIIGMFLGHSGEYNKGYLNGYRQCLLEFNITGIYNETKRLSEKGN